MTAKPKTLRQQFEDRVRRRHPWDSQMRQWPAAIDRCGSGYFDPFTQARWDYFRAGFTRGRKERK